VFIIIQEIVLSKQLNISGTYSKIWSIELIIILRIKNFSKKKEKKEKLDVHQYLQLFVLPISILMFHII